MADKAKRSTDKLMDAIGRQSRADVCAKSLAIKEEMQSEIVKLAHRGEFEAIRNLANEAIVIENIRRKC